MICALVCFHFLLGTAMLTAIIASLSGILALALILVALMLIRRKRKRQQKQDYESQQVVPLCSQCRKLI